MRATVSAITMPTASKTQDGTANQADDTTPGTTRNSRSVAAATPRWAPPAIRAAEPVTTTSLKYCPGRASVGTTRLSGMRADWPCSSVGGRPDTRIQLRGTVRPAPREMRSIRIATDSACEPVLTTYTGGSAYV